MAITDAILALGLPMGMGMSVIMDGISTPASVGCRGLPSCCDLNLTMRHQVAGRLSPALVLSRSRVEFEWDSRLYASQRLSCLGR